MVFWLIVDLIVAMVRGTAIRFDLRRRRNAREAIQRDGRSAAESRRPEILTDPATVTAETFGLHRGGTGGGGAPF